MLRLVFIAFLVAFTDTSASLMPSAVIKEPNKDMKPVRTFVGTVEAVGFWRLLFSDYKYFLRDKEQRVALDFSEKVYSPEILKAFVGKEVIVKGSPRYINKEPFMVVKVEDVSVQ